jgi:hypothetical protein
MAARKLAVSFDEDLARAVDEAAEQATEGNVSAWLAEAARARLRHEAGQQLLEELMAGQPPITEVEREQVRKEWPRG